MNRRKWRQLVVCACIAGATLAVSPAALAVPLETVALPALPGSETEPNDVAAAATPITSGQRVRASLAAGGDVDYYSFNAAAGERIFANTVTAGSATGFDTVLKLLNGEGVTIAEDDDDGSQFARASSIAGAAIPADGIYYLVVSDAGTTGVSPYDLYFQQRAAAPPVELEPNNKSSEANPLNDGEVTGAHSVGDQDWFSMQLQAGDTVFLSLALASALPGEASNAQLGFGLAGDGDKQVLGVPGESESPDSIAPSEALTMTVSSSGTYYVKVASREDSLTENWSYDLSATVIPAGHASCRAYPSAIGEIKDAKTMIFPIPIEDSVEISRAAVSINLVESVMADLDVSLRTPAAVELPLFNDIGSTSSGGQTQMDAVFDDFAAVPPLYKALRPLDLEPGAGSRLGLLANQPSQGTWGLVIKDDQLNSSVGNLKSAHLILCGPDALLPPGSGGSGGKGAQQPQSNPPKSPPTLSSFAIAPGKFRAAKAGPMVIAKRPKAGGALVTYQSSEPAQTNLVLFELEEGRKVGKKCVRPTASNSTKKPCVRPVKVISFVRNDAAGRNQFGFTGRVGARKLPPGEYRLQARAYATSGLTSAPVSATFKVLPPATKDSKPRRR